MISLGFATALMVGVVVALLVLLIGLPVISLGKYQQGLHDGDWSDSDDLLDVSTFFGDDSSDSGSGD